jgi:hypothetical protein
MPPTAKSKNSSAQHNRLAAANAVHADKAPREHILDDSPLLQGLGPRRVFCLGPIGVDRG